MGHVLGGWTFSPLFTAQSGNPIYPAFSEGGCTGCQAFGEVSTTSSATTAFIDKRAGHRPLYRWQFGALQRHRLRRRRHHQPVGCQYVRRSGRGARRIPQMHSRVRRELRRAILCAACRAGTSISGSTRTSRYCAKLPARNCSIAFTNVLNHVVMGNPALTTTSPSTFGRITSQANTPRNMEFGLRLHF